MSISAEMMAARRRSLFVEVVPGGACTNMESPGNAARSLCCPCRAQRWCAPTPHSMLVPYTVVRAVLQHSEVRVG